MGYCGMIGVRKFDKHNCIKKGHNIFAKWTNNPVKSKALGKRKSEDEVTNFFESLQ